MAESVADLPKPLQMQGVRTFSLAALDAQIDQALAALPKDAAGAVVLYGARKEDGTLQGKLAYAANLGDGWSAMVEVDASKELEKDLDVGARAVVRKVW